MILVVICVIISHISSYFAIKIEKLSIYLIYILILPFVFIDITELVDILPKVNLEIFIQGYILFNNSLPIQLSL